MLRFGRRRERENAKCIDNVCRRLCLNATYVYCRLPMISCTSLVTLVLCSNPGAPVEVRSRD